jgi:hypothetical protein
MTADELLDGSDKSEADKLLDGDSADSLLDSSSPNLGSSQVNLRKQEQESMEKLEKYTESRRGAINVREGFHGTFAGQRMFRNEMGDFERAQIEHFKKKRSKYEAAGMDVDAKIAELDQVQKEKFGKARNKRAAELAEMMRLPDWYNDEKFVSRLAKMSESFLGQLIGGSASPENFIPVGKGASAMKTFLKGFAANAPLGASSDLMSQVLDVEMGLKDEIDWEQVVLGGATSGAMGGGMNAGGHHGSFTSEPKQLGPSGEALSPEVAKADEVAKKLVDRNTAAPKSEADALLDGEYPEIDPEFKVDQPIDESQFAATKAIDDNQPLPEFMYGTKAEGETPEPTFPDKLPEIERFPDEPALPPDGLPDLTENGFGPDLKQQYLEDAPFLRGPLAEQANVDEVPGSHNLEFMPNDKDANAPLGISGEGKNPYASQPHVDALNEKNRLTFPEIDKEQGTHKMGFKDNLKKFLAGSKKQEEVYHVPTGGRGFYDFDTSKGFVFFSEDPSYGKKVFGTDREAQKYNIRAENPLDLTHVKTDGELEEALKRLGIQLENPSPNYRHSGNPAYTLFANKHYGNQIAKAIKAKGYDSVKIFDEGQTSWLIVDPKQVFPKGAKEQGTHQMGFRKIKESAQLAGKELTEADVILADRMHGVKTINEAVQVVAEHGSEEGKRLAKLILERGNNKDVRAVKLPILPEEAGSVDTTAVTGDRTVYFDPRGHLFYGETLVLHEAVHVRTNDALYAYIAGNATPEQAAYGKKVHDLYNHVKKRIFDHVKEYDTIWLKNLNEFNAYGLTDKEFIEALKKIPYRGESAWAKFLDYTQSLFGIHAGDKSAFKALMDSADRWDVTQSTDRQRGKSVSILKDKYGDDYGSEAMLGLGVSKKNQDAFAKKLAAHHQQFKTVDDLRHYLNAGGKIEDINLRGNFVTQNQLAMISDNNPVIPFVFNYLSDKARQAEVRMYGYDQKVKESINWSEKNPEAAVQFFRELERLNVDPKLRQLRSQLEADPVALAQHFASRGIKPDTLNIMRPFMEVLGDVRKSDTGSLAKHNRTLDTEPLYWPLNRPGPYHFIVTDPEGQVVHAGGHQSLSEAHRSIKAIKAKMPPGWTVSDVVRTDPSRTINPAMAEAIAGGAPEWLRAAAMSHYSRKLEYRRNFELGRSNIEVGGYIGEVAPKTPKEFKEALNKYLDSFSHRVRESHHLENGTAAVEIARGLMGEGSKVSELPNTNQWLSTMISRHVGIDTALTKQAIDIPLQRAVNAMGRVLTKMDAALKDYEPGKNDNVLAPNLAKSFAQAFSMAASISKIGLSPQVLGGNIVSNAIPWAYGARDLARMGKSPLYAFAAQIDHLAYMATAGTDPRFAWVKDKMKQAKEEGMIDPHGREDYSAVENISRFHTAANTNHGVDKAAGMLFAGMQKPRDWIEQGTNWSAILYNHFLVKRAFPDLDPKTHDQVVYNLAKSFAGDYSKTANLFAFEKAGTVGHLGSNFAKWKFNRTSRYIDDAIMAASMSEYGVKSVMPLLWSIGIGGVMAGIQGSIGVVEYEAVRRLGTMTGLWDWKPLSAILGETEFLKKMDGSARTIVEKGIVTGFSDHIAQQFGEPSGPDISGSVREASVMEAPFVATSVAKDILTAGAIALKSAMSRKEVTESVDAMEEGTAKDIAKWMQDNASYGLSSDESKAVVKALPKVIQEAVRNQFVKKIEVDGKTKYVVPEAGEDAGSFIRSEFQQNLALAGGLKTTEETRYEEGKQYHKWMERKSEKKYTALSDGIINNLDKPELVDRNMRLILENHGQDALEKVATKLDRIATQKMQTDYFGNKSLAAARMKDGIAAEKAAERIRKAMAVAKPDTHHLKTGPLDQSEVRSEGQGAFVAAQSGESISLDNKDYTPSKRYPTVDAAIPNLRARGYKGMTGTRGFMREKDENDMVFVNTDKYGTDKERDFTLLHEAEHVLQKKGLDSPSKINSEFDKVVGDDGSSRRQMTRALTTPDVREHLKKNWGITDSYFDPKMYEIQGSRAKNLLYEQFASMAAAENQKGVEADMTKDPFLRKHVFDTAAKREAFRAMVGLRQTRLDAKDLKPYTRVKEKEDTRSVGEKADDTIRSFLRKHILKD